MMGRAKKDNNNEQELRSSLLQDDYVGGSGENDVAQQRGSINDAGGYMPLSVGFQSLEWPEERANPLSRATMWWIFPLMRLGSQRTLEKEDLYPLEDKCSARKCFDAFDSTWRQTEGTRPAQRIRTTILRLYWRPLALAGLCLVASSALSFAGPLILYRLVVYVRSADVTGDDSSSSTDDSSVNLTEPESVWYGLFFVVVLFVGRVMQNLYYTRYSYFSQKAAMMLVTALKCSIYDKAMRLTPEAKNDHPTSAVVNLFNVDVERITMCMCTIHEMWVFPLFVVFALVLLHALVGWASLGGFCCIILALVAQSFVATQTRKISKSVMAAKDVRMKTTSEMFSNIKYVKLSSWEQPFKGRILEQREDELKVVWKETLYSSANVWLLWLAPVMVSVVTFTIYTVGMKNNLSPAKVFTVVALFRLLQEPLRSLPNVVTYFIQARVSLERVSDFMLSPQLPDIIVPPTDKDCALHIRGSFGWTRDESHAVLKNIELSVAHGELVVIHGRVASGKSSLCSALIGDMYPLTGATLEHGGTIAYCAQQAWIQNLTVKENILFGRPYERERYEAVVEACCLKDDFDILADGDETEIGEKGVNLSGGQKARVSLARALYSDSDVYILDDPFSALDALVGKAVFQAVAYGLLKGKTRVVVSHNPEIINHPTVSRTITMDEDGMFLVEERTPVLDMPSVGAEDLGESLPLSTATEADTTLESITTSKGTGKFTMEEDRAIGRTDARVYKNYIDFAGGWKLVVFLCLVQVVWQLSQVGGDWWLNRWSEQSIEQQNSDVRKNAAIFGLFYLTSAVAVGVRTFTVAKTGIRAARRLFVRMLESLLNSPMIFFDRNPIGRILNRMSDDQAKVDSLLPFVFGSMLSRFSLIGQLVVTSVVTKYLIIPLLPLCWVYFKLANFYLRSSREIQRLKKISNGPVMNHLSAAVAGASTVRAFKKGNDFIDNTFMVNDNFNKSHFLTICMQLWFSLRLQLLSSVIVFCVGFFVAIGRDSIGAGLAGMALSYALSLDENIQRLVQVWAWLENTIICAERIEQYTNTESELFDESPAAYPARWPSDGAISFDNVQFRYSSDGPLILKNLSFNVRGGSKVGLVGRTGAGKSTISLALFRICELQGGSIRIDDKDISDVNLRFLRSKISIVPQDPVLFEGPVQDYLDPFQNTPYHEIVGALESVGLGKLGPSFRLSEGGGNLSAGQKQMLALGRALLQRSRVVILDEATASVDMETDNALHEVMQRCFQNSTVLIIAHRLHTIINLDDVVVLSNGKVVEHGAPETLLADTDGVFYEMARESGLV